MKKYLKGLALIVVGIIIGAAIMTICYEYFGLETMGYVSLCAMGLGMYVIL